MKTRQFVPKKITEYGNLEFYIPFFHFHVVLNKTQFAISLVLLFIIGIFYRPTDIRLYPVAMILALIIAYYFTKDNKFSRNRMQIVFVFNYLTRDKKTYRLSALNSNLTDNQIKEMLEQQ